MQLRKAQRTRQHLRIALCGPAGSGKTFTALRVAHAMVKPGDLVAVIDSENGSSELYQGEINPDGGTFDFCLIDLAKEPGKYSVDNYVRALRECAKAGAAVTIIDSLSHAWAGEGGVLSLVDRVAAKNRGNSYSGWKEGTPEHNRLLQAMLDHPGHLIATMRSKVEYVLERDSRGKSVPRKVGMAPVQRDGVEYEFTVTLDIDTDTHSATVSKTRCSALADQVIPRPGANMAQVLLDWLEAAPIKEVSSGRAGVEDAGGVGEGPPAVDAVQSNTAAHGQGSGSDARSEVVNRPDEGEVPESFKWTEGERKRFFAKLNDETPPLVPVHEALRNYDTLAAFMEHIGRPRPSVMTERQRDGLINWLRSDKCAEHLDQFFNFLADRQAADEAEE